VHVRVGRGCPDAIVEASRNDSVFNGAMQQAATIASWIREEAAMWVNADVSPALAHLMQLASTAS
jgi:hypothetical protein